MSEERKLILQMVADGKISADEAEMLLQAIDETERATYSAASESAQTGGDRDEQEPDGLGETISRVVTESFRDLEQTLNDLDRKLRSRLDDPVRKDLRLKVEQRMRRAAERAIHEATLAEQRAADLAERMAKRSEKEAERLAERAERLAEREAERMAERTERMAERAERMADRMTGRLGGLKGFGGQFLKFGVSIDKEQVMQERRFTIEAEPGDRFLLEHRVGDVNLLFGDGDEIEVEARLTSWGEDEKDALERAEATGIELVRRGSTVELSVVRPSLVGVGFIVVKDTRIDLIIRLPQGTHLDVLTKVGDLRVAAGTQVGNWKLRTKVGNIDIDMPKDADFHYSMQSKLGRVTFESDGRVEAGGSSASGNVGTGTGLIDAGSKTGNIRIHR